PDLLAEIQRHDWLNNLEDFRAQVLCGGHESRWILRVRERVGVDDSELTRFQARSPQAFAKQRHEIGRDVGADREANHRSSNASPEVGARSKQARSEIPSRKAAF